MARKAELIVRARPIAYRLEKISPGEFGTGILTVEVLETYKGKHRENLTFIWPDGWTGGLPKDWDALVEFLEKRRILEQELQIEAGNKDAKVAAEFVIGAIIPSQEAKEKFRALGRQIHDGPHILREMCGSQLIGVFSPEYLTTLRTLGILP